MKFSPSILGVNTPIFGLTPTHVFYLEGADSDSDSVAKIFEF